MEVGYLCTQLAELGGHMRVWPDAASAMRMMLSSAAARGEPFAAPCLALLEHAMAPLAPGSIAESALVRPLPSSSRRRLSKGGSPSPDTALCSSGRVLLSAAWLQSLSMGRRRRTCRHRVVSWWAYSIMK